MERENIYKGSTFNMKCQYCGAVLNLTDEVCPHCGRKNRAGEAYKKDYDKYQSKVNTAEKSISAQQLYTVKVLVRGVAIAVLLAMFIGLVVYMLTHDWYFIKQKNAVSEYDTGRMKITMISLIIVTALIYQAGQMVRILIITHR